MEICSTATWFAEYFRGYVALAPHTGNGKRARVLQHHAGGTVDRTVLREALPGGVNSESERCIVHTLQMRFTT